VDAGSDKRAAVNLAKRSEVEAERGTAQPENYVTIVDQVIAPAIG
jgi:hypothetical protein